MRIVPFLISTAVTAGLIVGLNRSWGPIPPLGSFFSPQHGFWQNADPVGKDYSENLVLPGLKEKATIYFDARLVPHVFADNSEDACYIQGYLHAKFRLWQMEFQVYAAAGRVSEILGRGPGDGYLKFDRTMRRLGMVTGAEKAVAEIEKDSTTKKDCDAYTAGVNEYISRLKESELPLEYKLLNYRPEPWSNLKIALFMKNMAYELAGGEDDFEMTNAKSIFSKEDFAKLYPSLRDSLDPIIPKGTVFQKPSIDLKIPATVDSLYLGNRDSALVWEHKPEKANGSNNWAVSGKKTLSGRPILCNDPHLGTNMPAIWYEMQIQTPAYNTYGVSFPGAPYVIIGFNDFCAWGVTNAERDVRDYYQVRFKDSTKREYWFDGQWKAADKRIEEIRINGQESFLDTVAYTVFGPVMYDNTFNGSSIRRSDKYYAVRWTGDDPSDELSVFNNMRLAKTYDDYREAVRALSTPGQNFIFAAKDGDIAIRQQGSFPAKWKKQGLFVMPGEDSSYLWQATIPGDEAPALKNPERGFVSSANQPPADSAYPYYLGGDYPIYRGLIINRYLGRMDSITPRDMMKMQTDNYDVFAEMARPLLLRYLNESQLSMDEKKYLALFRDWDLRDDANEKAPIIFREWWSRFEDGVWSDEFSRTTLALKRPDESVLLEALLKDSTFSFVDNINTAAIESLRDVVTAAFIQSIPVLEAAEKEGRFQWAQYKDTWVRHLLRLPALSRMHVPIGGGANCINAANQFHGPSWRMIVQLTDKTEAYGVYPGGQSGNPGSPFYDDFIDKWAAGKYYPLWVMDRDDARDKRVKWKITAGKGDLPTGQVN
ncbi:MAG: penicillin acylase family protein [Puia sp.]|nr:penicillin acylase family protein [Puia sp.]